jgi:hypothetical protein
MGGFRLLLLDEKRADYRTGGPASGKAKSAPLDL